MMMMMTAALPLLLLLLLLGLGSLQAQTVPNANCQCQIIRNTPAYFCQAYTSLMCSNLYCATYASGTCAATGYAAATGTVCGSGMVCQNGQCVSTSTAVATTCLYGDSLVYQNSAYNIQLPYSPMTCAAVISYLYSINLSPLVYCGITAFQQACCQTCQTYNYLSCYDMYPVLCSTYSSQCNNYNYLISGMPIFITCRRTCGLCYQNQLTCYNGLCQNGATCVPVAATNDLLVNFYCQCPTGYSGQFCQLKNPCNPNPCLNGGTCSLVNALSYTCTCPANYYGTNCAYCSTPTTVCTVNPCQNGGTCTATSSSTYYCTCPSAYTGNVCQYSSGCLNSPCQNGGVCYAIATQSPYYYCVCYNGYYGTNCQYASVTTASSCKDYDVQFCPYAKANSLCTLALTYQGLSITVYCGVSCGTCSSSG